MSEHDELFSGSGQVASLLREHDWSRCALGLPAQWLPEWRMALRMMLASGLPMCLTLDREKGIFFNNDPYIPIVADKFPWCLGRPAREVWPEIWDMVQPHADAVRETGGPGGGSDLRSMISRNGRMEEAYFTYSTNALEDERRRNVGLFTVVVETTARVLAERRLTCLRDLAAGAFDAMTVEEACRRAAEVLDRAADVPAAMLYVVDDDGAHARCVATVGAAARGIDHGLSRVSLRGVNDPMRIGEVVQIRRGLSLVGVERICFPSLSPGTSGFVLPILERMGDYVGGVLVAAAAAVRPIEEVRDFLELVTAQLAIAFTNARAKQHAERRARELAALNEAKSEFFANVSHELRTPLSLLLGPLSEVLASGRLSPEDRALLVLARSGASRMHKLVGTLLDFSRVEAGRFEPRYEATDLARYTRDLASMFQAAFEAAGIRFVVDAPPLPEQVFVDREMWEKILLNLLSNALKFTFEGEVRLRLHVHDGGVRLSVSDTGCGIAEKHLPHVFERFYRAETPRARTREGSGIGLSLVRELARLHGGSVSIESAAGRGTTLHVDVPIGRAHLPADRTELPVADTAGTLAELFREEAFAWIDDPKAQPAPAGARSPPAFDASELESSPASNEMPAPSSAQIVLADDSAQMRAYLAHTLGKRWQVRSVSDGEAALALTRSILPELVVADVMMPGLDGFALITALRADPATADIPVLLVSARAGDEATEHALEAGAADYVVKPFSPRELMARVQVQLTQARLKRAERAARELAETESRARERFLAMLSHELRTPLSAILGWLELLRTGRLGPEEARRALGIIEQSAGMQKRLIEDLLDVSRIVSGRLTLSEGSIDSLAPQLQASLDSFRLTAAEKGVRIEAAIEPSAGPLRGDAQRLQQVATNLIGNAIKFTPAGGVVRVSCVRRQGQLEVSVSDTGKGIAAAALPHVFDDFWMGNNRQGRAGGLGLGLAIARSIVSLHGGTLHVESRGEQCGATFAFRLPLSTGDHRSKDHGSPEDSA